MAAYSVSKAALVHLTRTLDLELRPYGIRVSGAILPVYGAYRPGQARAVSESP